MDAILRDLRDAVRQWRRSPVVAVVALLSLTLGIGATVALFALVEAVYLKPLPVRDPDALVKVDTQRLGHLTQAGDSAFPTAVWEHLRDAQPVFAGVAAADAQRINLSRDGESRFVQALYVSGSFFEVVGVPMRLGRPISSRDDVAGAAAVTVIDHAFWRRELGGRADVVGTTIALEGRRVEIVGVTGPDFFGVEVGRRMQIYVPIALQVTIHGQSSIAAQSTAAWLTVFGRLRAGQSLQQTSAALRAWQPALRRATWMPGVPEDQHLVDPLDLVSAAYGTSRVRRDVGMPLLILLGGVALVLVMACANLAALMGARLSDRRADLWTRRALGASTLQVVRSAAIETLVLSTTGAVLGVAVALWLTSIVVPSIMPSTGRGGQAYLAVSLDWSLVAVAVVLAVVSGVITGVLPALRVTRALTLVHAWPRIGAGQSVGSRRGMLVLVTAQVALSLVLVSSAGLLVRTFLALTLQPTAVDRDRVLLASLSGPVFQSTPARTLARLDSLMQRFALLPGIRAVSVSTVTPMSGLIVLSLVEVPGHVSHDSRDRAVAVNRVTPRFFEVFGTPLLAGRGFDERDGAEAARVAIVNRAFERQYLAGREAVGRAIKVSGQEMRVVGVVATAKYMTLRESTRSVVYVPLAQRMGTEPQPLRFGVRSDSPDKARGFVLDAVRRFDPRLLVEFRTLYDEVASSIGRERTLAWSGGLVGVLAVSLAAMGLYGAFSYMVTRRHAEMAIRIALGAGTAVVRGIVLWSVLKVLLIGCALGAVGIFLSATFIESQLHAVRAVDPWMLGLTLVAIAIVTAAATVGPIRCAARVDPGSYLRAL